MHPGTGAQRGFMYELFHSEDTNTMNSSNSSEYLYMQCTHVYIFSLLGGHHQLYFISNLVAYVNYCFYMI